MASEEDLKAEIERLRAENEALKKPARGQMSLKVSEKGGLSVYGLGRFPVTLYREQWEKLLGKVSSAGKPWGDGVTEKLVWHVVKEFAARIGIDRVAPHDLRRTCARLCRAAGGELEQIQFLLGHISVQTTERYLGCTQRIAAAVNDRIGIEPTS
jgi:hypothetical protein